MRRIQVGDLSRYGIGKAPGFTARIRQRRFPIIDRGFISALKSRSIEVVQAVTKFEKEDVILSDGTRVRPDVVIAATGYRTGLESLVGHLGVLDDCGWPIISGDHAHPATPSLYFMGFKYQPTGALRAHGIDAPKLARKIAKDLRRCRSGSAIISVPNARRMDLT